LKRHIRPCDRGERFYDTRIAIVSAYAARLPLIRRFASFKSVGEIGKHCVALTATAQTLNTT
jgi:hypothetical protein